MQFLSTYNLQLRVDKFGDQKGKTLNPLDIHFSVQFCKVYKVNTKKGFYHYVPFAQQQATVGRKSQ